MKLKSVMVIVLLIGFGAFLFVDPFGLSLSEGGANEQTPTPTPSAAPSTVAPTGQGTEATTVRQTSTSGQTVTTNNQQQSFPDVDWINDNGTIDASRLLSLHQQRVSASNHNARYRLVIGQGNNSTTVNISVQTVENNSQYSIHQTIDQEGQNITIDIWGNASVTYERQVVNGGRPTYDVSGIFRGQNLPTIDQLAGSIHRGEYTFQEERINNGQLVYFFDVVITSTRGDDSSADVVYEGTLTVRRDGLIKSLLIRERESSSGQAERFLVEYSSNIINNGRTLSPPAWNQEAIASRTRLDIAGEVIGGGEAVRVDNVGDGPYPSGSTLTIATRERVYNVTLTEAVPVEGTRYLYKGTDGELAVSTDTQYTTGGNLELGERAEVLIFGPSGSVANTTITPSVSNR